MSNETKAVADKAKNYSAEQEKYLVDNSPLDLQAARDLTKTDLFAGKSYRSIIAKIKSLGLEYKVKPAPTKKIAPVTKAQLVGMISDSLETDNPLTGLDKATAGALLNLLKSIADITGEAVI